MKVLSIRWVSTVRAVSFVYSSWERSSMSLAISKKYSVSAADRLAMTRYRAVSRSLEQAVP